MPLELQAKVLRVIETREVERLGGTAPVAVDVRILASTHRDLIAAVQEGRFRQDLYYRLNVFPIVVPPLRERTEDIEPLAVAFAGELLGPAVSVGVTPGAAAALRRYAWPGNVRELRNAVERLSLLRPDERSFVIDEPAVARLGLAVAPPPVADSAPAPGLRLAALGVKPLREILEEFESEVLKEALARSEGNVALAARLLLVDRGNLYRRARALHLLPAPGDRRGD